MTPSDPNGYFLDNGGPRRTEQPRAAFTFLDRRNRARPKTGHARHPCSIGPPGHAGRVRPRGGCRLASAWRQGRPIAAAYFRTVETLTWAALAVARKDMPPRSSRSISRAVGKSSAF